MSVEDADRGSALSVKEIIRAPNFISDEESLCEGCLSDILGAVKQVLRGFPGGISAELPEDYDISEVAAALRDATERLLGIEECELNESERELADELRKRLRDIAVELNTATAMSNRIISDIFKDR